MLLPQVYLLIDPPGHCRTGSGYLCRSAYSAPLHPGSVRSGGLLQAAAGGGVIWVDRQRGTELLGGGLGLAGTEQDPAQAAMGVGIAGSKLDGDAILGGRFLVFLLIPQKCTQILMPVQIP